MSRSSCVPLGESARSVDEHLSNAESMGTGRFAGAELGAHDRLGFGRQRREERTRTFPISASRTAEATIAR